MKTDCCDWCREHRDPISGQVFISEPSRAWMNHMITHPWAPAVHIHRTKERGPIEDGWVLRSDIELLYTRVARIRWSRSDLFIGRSNIYVGLDGARGRIGRLEFSFMPISKRDWHDRAKKPWHHRWWKRLLP